MLLRIVLLAVCAVLSACSSFTLSEPTEGLIVQLPSTVRVAMTGNPTLNAVQVKDNNNDVSNQMSYVTSNQSQGNLSLAAGKHTIDVAATVNCWYCSNGTYRPTETRIVHVIPQGSAAGPTKTAFSNTTSRLSWSASGIQMTAVATDAGQAPTRWSIRRQGGIASSVALIESAAFPTMCLRSDVATQNAAVGMSPCDVMDPLQIWQALPAPGWAPGNYRIQNTGRGVSDACLTEGAAPARQLIQRACLDTPDQVWTFKDNQTGQSGVDPLF